MRVRQLLGEGNGEKGHTNWPGCTPGLLENSSEMLDMRLSPVPLYCLLSCSQHQLNFTVNLHIFFSLLHLSFNFSSCGCVFLYDLFSIKAGGREKERYSIWCGNTFSFVSKNHLLIYKIQTKLLGVQEPLLGSQAQTVPAPHQGVLCLFWNAQLSGFLLSLGIFPLFSHFIDLNSA